MKLTPLRLLPALLLPALLLSLSCDQTDSKSAAATPAAPAASASADTPSAPTQPAVPNLDPHPATVAKLDKSDADWQQLLTPTQFKILRQQGTEPPFHNPFFDNHAPGEYRCAACGLALFESKDKFDSGTGWPSFTQPASDQYVLRAPDPDGQRTELKCARCNGHLGHVFNDGPPPTNLRYCIDSASLIFVPAPTTQPTP